MDEKELESGSKEIKISKTVSGVDIDLAGKMTGLSPDGVSGTIKGPEELFVINIAVEKSSDGFLVKGDGNFTKDPLQGSISASVETDTSFNPDMSTLQTTGEAAVNKDISGVNINLVGAVEDGRLSSLSGTIQGLGGAYVINASIVDNGDGYTISGDGEFVAGPVQGSASAEISTDDSFNLDPSSLNISGQASIDKEMSGIRINMEGAIENGRLSNLSGSIEGMGGAFLLNASVIDNGDGYNISGGGEFVAGPVEGSVSGEIVTDDNFVVDPSTLNISGDISFENEYSGIFISMQGSLVEGRFDSLFGDIIGPNNMFDLSVSVVDNGEGYTVSGSGEFTAGPAVGSLTGQIDTDDHLNPIIDTLDVGGDVTVNTDVMGNHIEMSGTMEHMSLQSLYGTIIGPNGMYLLEASVEDNGEGYTITATGDFHAGPIEGTVTGQINTDTNFSPHFDTLSISGEASVDTETAGHHIMMNGVMENGRLVSLEGTIVGPSDLYTITASINDNGEGYTIIGDGTIEKDIIKGHVHGEINTDDNFNPDFETLNFGGEVTIESESAGQKISGSAVVNNGYLESITAEMEGPGGLYTLYAQGVREEEGYDLEAGAEFQFFKTSMDYEFPPILIPTGVPGLNIDIEIGMGFEADASAQLIAGIKTDPHFMPDISTFEIRAATIIGHGSVYVDLFGGLSINLGIASVGVGIKAKLQAILDAYMTMSADSKGFKLSGNLYGQLMGALYAAIKMKFLFFKKEFDFLIVEGMVASLEKDFGPEDFTIANLIKAFSFGFDDFSLPGKERKGKTPSLDDQRKKNEEQTGEAADEDQKAKQEEKEKESSESDSADNSENDSASEEPKELSKSEKEEKFKEGAGPDAAQMKFKNPNPSNEPSMQLKGFEDLFNTTERQELDDPLQLQEQEVDPVDSIQLQEIEQPVQPFEDVNDSVDSIQRQEINIDSSSSNEPEIADEPKQLREFNANSDNSAQQEDMDRPMQFNSSNSNTPDSSIQKKSNGGLPSNLQSGVEQLSGQDMSDVKVNYNSDKPAQLNAHAYAQGNNIHLGPGQEKHLPHEAWHVAQQKQGRVKPTKQLKSRVNINDDPALEKEADIMGGKAEKVGNEKSDSLTQLQTKADQSDQVSQLMELDSILNHDFSEDIVQQNTIESDSSTNENTQDTLTN